MTGKVCPGCLKDDWYPSGKCRPCTRERTRQKDAKQVKRGDPLPLHPLVVKMVGIRRKQGLTQIQLELKAGARRQTLSRLESGQTMLAGLWSLTAFAKALGYRFTLVPRTNRRHDQTTIDQACSVVCPWCVKDQDTFLRASGTWGHRIEGEIVPCIATAIREKLHEPIVTIEEDVIAHHRAADERNAQGSIIKSGRRAARKNKKDDTLAVNRLNAAKFLEELDRN